MTIAAAAAGRSLGRTAATAAAGQHNGCGEGRQDRKGSGRTAGGEEAADAARIEPVLKEKVLERPRLDTERLKQDGRCLLVLFDRDLIAHQKLLGTLIGRDHSQRGDDDECQSERGTTVENLRQQQTGKNGAQQCHGLVDGEPLVGSAESRNRGRQREKSQPDFHSREAVLKAVRANPPEQPGHQGQHQQAGERDAVERIGQAVGNRQ